VYQVLLRDRAAMTDLIETVLTPLTTARGGARLLLDTLTAYAAHGGNTAATARALHLAVRTVTYRLDRIAALTGYDAARPDDRYVLQTAVLGARLLDWP
jgi:DNA-binding PucR family transcriptional regulator